MSSSEKRAALARLHAQMRQCSLCVEAGYPVYPRAIFSGGWGAQVMVIGQAPGITEKEAGRPFNASSGTRLFQWLGEAGMEENWFRATQYMTSVTKCYPGRSASGNGDRVPTLAEQRLCRPYLEEEIALINPRLILAVGRLAIGMFYAHTLPLQEIIGTKKLVDGRWVIPLPHPSGASRWHQQPENRQLIAKAIRLIREQCSEIFKGVV